jgi:hypothetical protein
MSKKDELNVIKQEKSTSPHLVRLSEHHLQTQEITECSLNN